MHPDVHLYLHRTRAAELTRAATVRPEPRAPIRSQLGWTMVELGLRLVSSSGPARPSAGLAARRSCPTA
nr:hypothetical protein [Streptomyces aureocirculatus]